MNLFEKVNQDIKEAMKAKSAERLSALRMLKAEYIKNQTSVKPQDELSITIAHAKKLEDSLELYPEKTPPHDKILQELEIIKAYLPQPLEENEVIKMIEEIKSRGAKDMGSIMKELQPNIKGRFNGKRASELVRGSLS